MFGGQAPPFGWYWSASRSRVCAPSSAAICVTSPVAPGWFVDSSPRSCASLKQRPPARRRRCRSRARRSAWSRPWRRDSTTSRLIHHIRVTYCLLQRQRAPELVLAGERGVAERAASVADELLDPGRLVGVAARADLPEEVVRRAEEPR